MQFKLWSLAFLAVGSLALADRGGNSSGGDEPFGAGTIPFEAPRARVVGVVSQVTPGTAGAPWRVKLARTVVGTAVEVDVETPRAPMWQPTVNALVFLRGTEPFVVGRVIPNVIPEVETAVADYVKDASPRARLDWAKARLGSASTYVSWSAQYELGRHATGPLKAEVLRALLDNPRLLRDGSMNVHTLASFLPDPLAAAELKAIALDGTLVHFIRSTAVRALLYRAEYRTLCEAWRDGKEGADAWLQAEAARIWAFLNQPRP